MKLPNSAIELIETWRLGFIATVAKDGTPNVSPKGTFIVVDDSTIAFGEMRSPNTMANIAHQSEVEVNFVNVLTRRGVRIRGDAEITLRGDVQFSEMMPSFLEIWDEELCAVFNAIIIIPVEVCKPLQSPIYELDGEEEALKTHWQNKIAEM